MCPLPPSNVPWVRNANVRELNIIYFISFFFPEKKKGKRSIYIYILRIFEKHLFFFKFNNKKITHNVLANSTRNNEAQGLQSFLKVDQAHMKRAPKKSPITINPFFFSLKSRLSPLRAVSQTPASFLEWFRYLAPPPPLEVEDLPTRNYCPDRGIYVRLLVNL